GTRPVGNLVTMGARTYDTSLGQFISPDTWNPDLLNTQSAGRDTNNYNNPENYNHPTGHQAIPVDPIQSVFPAPGEEVFTPNQSEVYYPVVPPELTPGNYVFDDAEGETFTAQTNLRAGLAGSDGGTERETAGDGGAATLAPEIAIEPVSYQPIDWDAVF